MRRLSVGLALPSQVSIDLQRALVRLHERASLSDVSDEGHDIVLRAASWPAPGGECTVRWLDDAADDWLPDARALVASPTTARRLRQADLAVPVVAFGPPRQHRSAVPVLPFSRSRIRLAHGISGAAIARLARNSSTWEGRSVPQDLLDTVAALAAVVVALDGPSVVRAAAWAAPIVTSPEIADEVGMSLLGAPDEHAAIERLVADQTYAARLAHAAYACYQQDHNPDYSFARIGAVANARVGENQDGMKPYLDALLTPPQAAIRRRSAEAFAALGSR